MGTDTQISFIKEKQKALNDRVEGYLDELQKIKSKDVGSS